MGEGTWPTIRTTLEKMGVSETEFFRHCDGAFKQGGKFVGWTTGAADDSYYHPLMLPQGFHRGESRAALAAQRARAHLLRCRDPAGRLCDDGLAPKTITTPEYQAIANYAYHLDAGEIRALPAKALHGEARRAPRAGRRADVNQAENGDIKSVVTQQAGEIARRSLRSIARGFAAILLGKTLGVAFKDCSDVLFCDTALAVQVPFETPDAPMDSQTIATAQAAGWIWDIALPTRRGIGYVYSSRHQSDEEAREVLARYVGPRIKHLSPRKIPIRAGHRETFWKNNCVAVGLAAGFLEPLEFSAIVLVEFSAKLIAEQMPANREVMDIVANRFNEVTLYRWGRIIDFLKLHYVLTKRTDTPFWVDNVDPAGIPDRLKNLLHLWKYQSPWFFDEFDRLEEVFPAASYQYVLYGMGFRTEVEPQDNVGTEAMAERFMKENIAITRKMRSQLPKNRDLINKIHEYGLQPI